MAAKYAGMGASPDREVRALQENIRILQDEVTRLAGTVRSQSAMSVEIPDNGDNFTERDLERLRFEFDRHFHDEPEIPDPDDYNDISITYDSDDSEYTITFTDFPFVYPGGAGSDVPIFSEASQTFIVDKPTTNRTLRFYADKDTGTTTVPIIRWSHGTSSDAATNLLYADGSGSHTEIGRIEILAFPTGQYPQDATHYSVTGQMKRANPILISSVIKSTVVQIREDLREVRLLNVPDPLLGTPLSPSLTYQLVDLPLEDFLILGWDIGDTSATFNLYSAASSYDEYYIIGKIGIDASNNVLYANAFPNYVGTGFQFGDTGSFISQDGKTVSVYRGRITKIL